jgi:hypothetical protein
MRRRSNEAVQQNTQEQTMINKIKDFVAEQAKVATEQARKFTREPAQSMRDATVKSAQRIRSSKDPVRAFSRSGVKFTAISQGTAQSLIELQAEMGTSALTEAAAQLERVATTQDVRELVRDQADVLRATCERIVNDLGQPRPGLRSLRSLRRPQGRARRSADA